MTRPSQRRAHRHLPFALRPRVAARSPINDPSLSAATGADAKRSSSPALSGVVPASPTLHALPRPAVGHRRPYASLVASLALGLARLELGRMTRLSHRRVHRRLPSRLAARACARSPIGASLPAVKAGACGREALIQSP